jgi:hypothetical protein
VTYTTLARPLGETCCSVLQVPNKLPIPQNMHPSHDRQTSGLNMVELESKRRLSAQLQDGLPFKNCTGSNVQKLQCSKIAPHAPRNAEAPANSMPVSAVTVHVGWDWAFSCSLRLTLPGFRVQVIPSHRSSTAACHCPGHWHSLFRPPHAAATVTSSRRGPLRVTPTDSDGGRSHAGSPGTPGQRRPAGLGLSQSQNPSPSRRGGRCQAHCQCNWHPMMMTCSVAVRWLSLSDSDDHGDRRGQPPWP